MNAFFPPWCSPDEAWWGKHCHCLHFQRFKHVIQKRKEKTKWKNMVPWWQFSPDTWALLPTTSMDALAHSLSVQCIKRMLEGIKHGQLPVPTRCNLVAQHHLVVLLLGHFRLGDRIIDIALFTNMEFYSNPAIISQSTTPRVSAYLRTLNPIQWSLFSICG